jgi:2-C-methyl-D-erythritol 4-phosphate cytidylyltransferase
MKVFGVILAGGTGQRFGDATPKQFIRLAGEPVLRRSTAALASSGLIDQVVVVANAEWLQETHDAVAGLLGAPINVVRGGATRNESTRAGLTAVGADAGDIVLIHDAVRPLLSREVIERVIAPLREGRAEAVDTVIPTADTLVVVEGDRITDIPERSRFRRGQTPQGFVVGTLRQAYEATPVGSAASDDCTLVLRHVPGARLVHVAGDEENIKITTRIDLVLADRLLQLRAIGGDRIASTPATAGSWNDRRVLIIGGTHGIGAAIADAAQAAGAQVSRVGRGSNGGVENPTAVAEMVEQAAANLGGIDDVIVTAGILRIGEIAAQSAEEILETVAVNLAGSLLAARAAHPHLAASKGTLTLFTSSSFTRGRARYAAYSATKAAVVNMMQALADEWVGDGIRVNAVAPERANTEMRRNAFPTEDHAALLQPEAIAAATLALIRSGLTGQVLDVKKHEGAAPAD